MSQATRLPNILEDIYVAGNPGSSGGPKLVLWKAEVIGIETTRGNEFSEVHYCTIRKEDHIFYPHSRLNFCSAKDVRNYFASFSPKKNENMLLVHGNLLLKRNGKSWQ